MCATGIDRKCWCIGRVSEIAAPGTSIVLRIQYKAQVRKDDGGGAALTNTWKGQKLVVGNENNFGGIMAGFESHFGHGEVETRTWDARDCRGRFGRLGGARMNAETRWDAGMDARMFRTLGAARTDAGWFRKARRATGG